MCKQERNDSYEEENIKNRRRQKNINRSNLIAEDIAHNIRDYCQKVVKYKIYLTIARTFMVLSCYYIVCECLLL